MGAETPAQESMVKVDFRLLGDVALFVDGDTMGLGGQRQRSVLALLALQLDRPITAARLADRLWPDDQPLTAIKTVQVYVSRIRQALGPAAGRIISMTSGYRLQLADDEFDVGRFERGLRQAREALAAGSTDTARPLLDQALAEWSGPALGDLAGEPFARGEAGRLEELRLQAIEELFELRITDGSGRETIGELRRLVADEPARERLWRLLMLALYDDGRQSEALDAYQTARRYLADEMGLDPSPELQELERTILTQEAPRAQRGPRALSGTAPELLVRRSRRVVTVLRADRTPSGDRGDPEKRDARDSRAADTIRRAVERHGGIIAATDRNGVTAVFGLTVAREDDALRALRAAAELAGGDSANTDPGRTLRIGVATGEVVAGPVRADGPMLRGTPIETASSLAGLADPDAILVAGETAQLVGQAASVESASLPGDAANASSTVRLLNLTGREAIVRRTSTPFVGRTAELSGLLDVFERVAAEGTPGLATVIGAPGVGKSRLVAETFARMAKRATVLRSRCLPYGDGITYWPIRELVLAATGIAPEESSDVAIAKLNIALAAVDGGKTAADRIASLIGLGEAVGSAEDIPWAVRRLFEALAHERPLAILVDDLQWAEPALMDLLEHVLDLGRGPILAITIARPELEDQRPNWLARSNLFRLAPLDDNDAAQLLDRLGPDLPAGPVRRRILTAAEGNPLFVEQFVAYLREVPPDTDLSLPPTIAALLAARLDHLPDAERLILERAALIGRTFWSSALSDLLAPDERGDLSTQLAQLARRGLIRPEHSVFPGDDAYRFRHLLIRDAAYGRMLKRERAEFHERFADWLEDRVAATPGAYDLVVGYHLEQAYRYRIEVGDDGPHARLLARRALTLITTAGQAGEERGDTHATISLLRRALDLAPPPRQRIDLLISLGATLQAAGDVAGFDVIDREVASMLADQPDEGLAHRRWLSHAMYDAGLRDSASQTDAAYAFFERTGDRMGMISALEVAMMHPRHVADAVERLDRAVDLAFAIGRPDRAASISARSVWIFPDSPMPVSEGLARARRYMEWAGTNGFNRAMILVNLGQLEAMSASGEPWRRNYEEAKVIIDDLGLYFPLGVFGYPCFLGLAELTAGDPARVLTMLRECCSALERRGDEPRLASVAPETALALLAVGQLDDVERYALWGKDVAAADDLPAQADWRLAVSGLRSRQGRHVEAITLAREAVELLDQSDFVVTLQGANLFLAEALRGAGDEPAAREAAHVSMRLAAQKENRAALRKVTAFLNGSLTTRT